MLQEVFNHLPYKRPFLFVDHFEKINDEECIGSYTFREDEFFYEGHFPGKPVTPGVILTEAAAQIGLVGMGIYFLLQDGSVEDAFPVFSSSRMDFLLPVYPGESIKVIATKEYFRFGKLKSKVKILNSKDEKVGEGYLSGFISKN